MAQHLERVVGRIADAFKAERAAAGRSRLFSPSFEVDMQTLESLARQSSWIDVPHDVVRDNPLAPAFMTAEAFAWFLPVYMIVSATQYYESETLTSTLIDLSPRLPIQRMRASFRRWSTTSIRWTRTCFSKSLNLFPLVGPISCSNSLPSEPPF